MRVKGIQLFVYRAAVLSIRESVARTLLALGLLELLVGLVSRGLGLGDGYFQGFMIGAGTSLVLGSLFGGVIDYEVREESIGEDAPCSTSSDQ